MDTDPLVAAFTDVAPKRAEVARKVARHGYASESGVTSLFQATTAERVDEADLVAQIDARLRNSIAGVDPAVTLDLLTWWLYRASEEQSVLHRADVLNRLSDVGRFLHERETYHREWYTSIEPLRNEPLDEVTRTSLAAGFARGVAATYSHIRANLDIPRPDRLRAIAAGFAKHPIVVLRGASGQGKSALAYRYLHDLVPEDWRFRVRLVEGRAHAMSIATALLGHAAALEVPIVILVDVSVRDEGWPDLVRQLAQAPGVKVLVAIREEDWRRTQVFGYQVEFADVPLRFDREEAERVWNAIPAERRSARFRRFADAWTQFAEGDLLLEFVHLITEGTTLRERLRAQVCQRQQDERAGTANPKELHLLRLVAVASEYEGRLLTRSAVEHLELPAAPLVIDSMEREYLLRRTLEGDYLEGLHPVRSAIVTELLTDPAVAPWEEAAVECLALLDFRDVGNFLLHAAVRHTKEMDGVLTELDTLRVARWTAVGGIVRTLLWLGIRGYVDANRHVIGAAIKDAGKGWWTVLDTDLADAMPGSADSVMDLFARMVPPERLSQIRDLRRRQLPKAEAFIRLRTWLERMDHAPLPPSSVDDWRAVGEVLFWAGRLAIAWPLTDWLPGDALERAAKDLPLNVVGDVVAGLFEADEDYAASWLSDNRAVLIDRFRREELSVALLDDEDRLPAHFLMPPWLDRTWQLRRSSAIDEGSPVHGEVLAKVELMRRLFPDKNYYGCKGYGHLVPSLDLTHDDSLKTGIPRARLPLRWGPQVNALFGGLVELPRRPSDWRDYAWQIYALREETTRQLTHLCRRIDNYLGSSTSEPILNRDASGKALADLGRRARMPPALPRTAVDEWGYIDELRTEKSLAEIVAGGPVSLQRVPAIQSWRPLLKPVRDYASAVERFLQNAVAVISASESVAVRGAGDESDPVDGDSEKKTRLVRSTMQAIADLRLAARRLEEPFRDLLGDFFAPHRISELERQEEEVFERTWVTWRAYAQQPEGVVYRATRAARAEWDSVLDRLASDLARELADLSSSGLTVEVVAQGLLWGDDPALWLTVDSRDAITSYSSLHDVLRSVLRAVMSVEETEAREYAITERWSQVVVVPLVYGRSLGGRAWRVPMNVLLKMGSPEALKQFYSISSPIPPMALTRVGIELWDDARFEPGAKIAVAAEELLALGVHLADLSEVPRSDALAEELLRNQLDQVYSWIAEAVQKLSDGLSQANATASASSPVEEADTAAPVPSGGVLQSALQRLGELDQQEGGLNAETIRSWSDALVAISSSAMLVYLMLVMGILETGTSAS